MGEFCTVAASAIAMVLVLAASRRLILAYAAASLYRPAPETAETPTFWIICACRNEAARLPRLVATLRALRYRGTWRVVLIDDASSEETPRLMAEAAAADPQRFLFVGLSGRQHGKAAALHEGLAGVPIADDDLMMVLDADHRLAPDALDKLANYFAKPQVQAVAIEHPVDQPARTLVSAYCYLEAAVSEVVTSRGQHAIGLPAKLAGSWACRAPAFRRFYPDGWQMADDTVFTAAIVADGGQVAYAADVAALQDVPETISGYLGQHVRWSAGYAESAARSLAARVGRHGLLANLDALATHAGYFERPLLLVLLIVAALGWAVSARAGAVIALGVIGVYVAVIALQILVALRLSHAPRRLVLMSLAALPLLGVDILVSIRGVVTGLAGRRVDWTLEHRG